MFQTDPESKRVKLNKEQQMEDEKLKNNNISDNLGSLNRTRMSGDNNVTTWIFQSWNSADYEQVERRWVFMVHNQLET